MSDKKMLKFPEGFLWGGATASEQSEGRGTTGKGKTTWDKFFEEMPQNFFEGVGPEKTNDFAIYYKEDLKLFKQIGANSVRLGFSWARLFPDGKTLNQKAVDYYHDLIAHANKNGLTLIMTIFHFDMPLWAQDIGGWESKAVTDYFAEFCEFIYKEFGNEVPYLATMNEPFVPVHAGYFEEVHWPMVRDAKRGAQAGFGTLLAHSKAVKIYNDKYRGKIKAKIGVVISVSPAIPKDGVNFTEADQKAADTNNMMHNFAFLDPMIKGTFPEGLKELLINEDILPEYTQEELDIIAETKIDFIGTNYYGPGRLEHQDDPENAKDIFHKYAKHYKWPKARMNVFRGWEIYPEAMYITAKLIMDRYDNIPYFVSENGMGVQDEYLYKDENGVIQDDYRIAFVQEHLYWLHKAIEEGSNCFGYHMWAIFDCWSWINAYKNRYGYIEIDLETMKRIPKKSAAWLKETSTNNAIPAEFEKIEKFMNLKKVKHI